MSECGKIVQGTQGEPEGGVRMGYACTRKSDHAPPCIAEFGEAEKADGLDELRASLAGNAGG